MLLGAINSSANCLAPKNKKIFKITKIFEIFKIFKIGGVGEVWRFRQRSWVEA